MNIAGILMVHDDEEYLEIVLDDLEKYTDRIYVNLNDPTPRIKDIIENRKSVVGKIYTSNNGGRWSQGLQRDNTIRMLDDVKPDIVLFPDSDEIYPFDMKEQLETFWNDEEKVTFWFRLYYLWGDEDHYRNDRIWRKIHHVRAYKWRPGITYLPNYIGYANATTFFDLPRNSKYNSPSPSLHYGYMKEDCRARKYLRANSNYCDKDFRDRVDKTMLILEIPPKWRQHLLNKDKI